MTAHYKTDCLQSVIHVHFCYRGSHTDDTIYKEYEKIMALFQISNKDLLQFYIQCSLNYPTPLVPRLIKKFG